MSDISKICDYLNSVFTGTNGNLKGKPFQKGLFNGFCTQIDRRNGDEIEKQIILYSDVNGTTANGIYLDDKYPFQLYHRSRKQSIEEDENPDYFGDDILQKIIIFDMSLVCMVDKFNVDLEIEDLVTAVGLNMPNNIKPSSITGSQFKQCGITIQDVEINSETVFENEWGKRKSIPQQFNLVEIQYQVRLNYNKNCFTLC